jgi:hypothetical protein
VGDGEAKGLAAHPLGERPLAVDPEGHVAALEAQVGVAGQRAREDPRLGEDLKPVADAQEQATAVGVGLHRGHDVGEARDGAAAEVVPVGEASREHHEVGARGQLDVLVEDVFRGHPEHARQGVERVEVRVGAWELYDRGEHRRAR